MWESYCPQCDLWVIINESGLCSKCNGEVISSLEDFLPIEDFLPPNSTPTDST